MTESSKAPQSVQSVDRVFDILETLSSYPQGTTLSNIANTVGLHISTAHRLLNTLISRGYVRKEVETGRYRMTLRLFEISSRVSNALGLLAISKELLEGLANQLQEAVHLVERDGSDVVYLYKFEPLQHLVNMSSAVGCRNPIYCTGVGKSILALLPESEQLQLWQQMDIKAYTPYTITDFSAMQKELAETRARGYALDNQEHELGVRCIAVAIRSWVGAPIAAISISATPSRLTDEKIEEYRIPLQHVCDEISSLLGYIP